MADSKAPSEPNSTPVTPPARDATGVRPIATTPAGIVGLGVAGGALAFLLYTGCDFEALPPPFSDPVRSKFLLFLLSTAVQGAICALSGSYLYFFWREVPRFPLAHNTPPLSNKTVVLDVALPTVVVFGGLAVFLFVASETTWPPKAVPGYSIVGMVTYSSISLFIATSYGWSMLRIAVQLRQRFAGNATFDETSLDIHVWTQRTIARFLAVLSTMLGVGIVSSSLSRDVINTAIGYNYMLKENVIIYGAIQTAALFLVFIAARAELHSVGVRMFHDPSILSGSEDLKTRHENLQILEDRLQVKLSPFLNFSPAISILAPLALSWLSSLLVDAPSDNAATMSISTVPAATLRVATPSEARSLQLAKTSSTVFSVKEGDLQEKWMRARAFIHRYGSMRIRRDSDVRIETFPPREGRMYGYTVVRSLAVDEQHVAVEVSCIPGSLRYALQAKQNCQILAYYVRTGTLACERCIDQ